MSATPVVLNITVLQPQTIQIISTPALTLGSAPHVVVVSASSGLDLSFTSLSLGVCQVGETTGVVVAVGAGSCTIRVSQAGNSQYDAVTSDVSFDVLRPKASAVTSVKASVKSRKLSLSWTAPANAVNAAISKYAVKYKVGAKGKWKTVYVTSRKWTSAAFARGSRVFFILYAVSARGNGSVYSSSKVIS
jgi:hypothetical protein